jgi:hypothetical protein
MTSLTEQPLELNDIVLPDPVSWIPQTPGSWAVMAVLVLAVLWVLIALLRRRRANWYRREALSRLRMLELEVAAERSNAAELAAIPVLVKETALAAAPRPDVAALSGEAWLQFLDATYGDRGFTTGPGRLLPVLAYGTPAEVRGVDPAQVDALFDLVRTWIRRHRVRV